MASIAKLKGRGLGARKPQIWLSSPGLTGRSSTPRPIVLIIAVSGILDHPLSRVMTTEYDFPISRRDAPEVLKENLALENQRARGRPGARCTRGLACNVHQKMRTRAYRFSGEHSGLPHAVALRLIRFRPGDRLSCHHHPFEALASHELDASTGASDPNDFAVRYWPRSSVAAFASTAPCPSFATMANAPGGTGWLIL
jgi:hypothetical protein